MKFIDYSIKNTVVVRFLVFLLIIGGIFSYNKLGKLEDPEFKIKEALVITLYPEADAHTVELQVTDKIEEAVNKLPNIDYIQSVSKPGYSEVKIKLDVAISFVLSPIELIFSLSIITLMASLVFPKIAT